MADTAAVTGKDGKLAAWDPKAGAVVRMAPDELESSFLKGDTHLVDGQSYPMLTQEGDVRAVPAKDVASALRDFGMRFGTQHDVVRAEAGSDAAKYRAFGEGVLNRVAFGFGDALQVASGVDPEGIQARAEQNPGWRGAGEITGAIGGGAAMGALGAGAMAAETAPTAGLATSSIPTVLTGAAGTAVEGAVHGVGDAVSEAALGKSDLTAESLIAHGGLGFALGGVLGGAMKIPQARAIRAADRAALMEGAGAEPESLAQAWSRAVDAYRNGPAIRSAESELSYQDALLGMSRDAQSAAEAELATGRSARKQSAINLGRAQKADLRDAQAEARLMDRLQKRGGKGMAREAADLEDMRAARGEAPPADIGSAETLPPGVARARAAQAANPGPDITAMEGRLADRQQVAQNFVERTHANVDDLRRAQAEQSLGQMERHIAEETPQITAAREAKLYVDSDTAARDMAQKGLEAELGQVPGPMFGARGPGMLGRGAAYAAGHVVGGPIGGFMAEELVGGANPVRLAALKRAGNVVREYIGDAMGRVVNGSFARSADIGLERAIAPSTLAVLNARDGSDRRKALATRMDELTSYGDDQQVSQRATAGTRHFGDIAPDAAGLVQAKAVQAAGYLRTVAPKPLATRNPLAPKPSYDLVSDRDARRFAEVDATVQDPLRIVDEMRAGRVPDPEAMRAVKILYPQTYQGIVNGFQEALAAHPNDVSWDTTLRVGLAFGLATSPALDPSNLSLQQRVAATPPSKPQGGGQAPQRPQDGHAAAYGAPSTLSASPRR